MSIQIAENHIKQYLRAYLLISFLFSFVVFLKLLLVVNMGSFNIILYDIYYYVMPSIAILIPLVSLRKPESKKLSRWQNYAIVIMIWVGLGFLYAAYCFNIPLAYTVFPLIHARAHFQTLGEFLES
jgi:hypothetical protein